MPGRTSSGSSGGSSSGGSSYRSSSSSSGWSSRRSYSSYDNDGDNEPASPEQQMFGLIMLGIVVAIVIVSYVGKYTSRSNSQRDNLNATRTVEEITRRDLATMTAALKDRIPEWQKVTDRVAHRISAQDAGFSDDFNTKEVDYGYCASGKFYVFVLNLTRPGGVTLADSEGYSYVPGGSPVNCLPEGWELTRVEWTNGDWSFVTIRTIRATQTAFRTSVYPQTATALASITPSMTPSATATLGKQ
jgi:hypothetical protein